MGMFTSGGGSFGNVGFTTDLTPNFLHVNNKTVPAELFEGLHIIFRVRIFLLRMRIFHHACGSFIKRSDVLSRVWSLIYPDTMYKDWIEVK